MSSSVIKIVSDGGPRVAITRALEGLGGLGAFVKSGDKVLLKPNFNTADAFPGSSDYDFLAAAADLCHEAGAAEVAVGDSCTYFLSTAKVMRDWGIERLTAGRPWLQVIDFDKEKWTKKDVPGGQYLKHVSVPEALGRFDRLVILPCLKTHAMAQYTGALKLSVGMMKPQERLLLHAGHIQQKIAEMNAVIRPDLVIMDARKCFITRGPMSGEVREPALILASTDRVALDIEGVKIIQSYEGNDLAGIKPEELPQIKRALEMGIA